ncbi:MAG: Holliday junction branch migration protein RuvA [Flammeovirgaceae bacterium]|nr:Holliday junction branch migration protein RuvA [Flammeovirgaceae bacterium]MBE63497.1 Holliday junction branch migration protein RuvA [Flammeovirgaceae bacterium]MBR06906.1 Holliday junction branch migration protein RuvA [Rickettsiales bacterium]HCX24394.1 Holliday junction branch migration protein RuvA [Cytophagales bacterium]|tara:strand:- start:5696 stop:6289 length:594 start_codon:yes stop_codon:yes gene_type:complete
MINYLEGKLVVKDPTYVVVDINGVGYEAKISLITYAAIKNLESTKIYTHLHIKEDAHTLYGFSEQSEKRRFLDLISISGVGPSTGLMILSSLSPEELQQAILSEDVKTIQGVKGIGLKGAQRIVLELKDKMKKEGLLEKAGEILPSSNNTLRNEALSALTTLGIAKPAAEKSIDTILKQHGQQMKLEELIKLALKRA